jgi:hypothetical protein
VSAVVNLTLTCSQENFWTTKVNIA